MFKKLIKKINNKLFELLWLKSNIGLNIVKNLVELHNGEIIATNNKNKGAKVEIIFPAI